VVRAAEHVTAAPRADLLPPVDGPEIALAGRSNVGKSSLLNALCGRRGLARISSTPGKTRLLHLYEITFVPPGRLWLCDLPGYGYAKVSHGERASWAKMVTHYVTGRAALRGLVALVDARRGVGEGDESLLALCAEAKLTPIVAVTKIDKLSKADRFPALRAIDEQLAALGAPGRAIGVSASEGIGLAELWRAIRKLAGAAAALALAAALFLAAPAPAAAADTGERLVDRILWVIGTDEVVTFTELEIEARLKLMVEVAGDARLLVRYPKPLTMDLSRADLKKLADYVIKQRLLWVEAKRHRKDSAPPEDVATELAVIVAKERPEEWARFEVLYGGTPAAIRGKIARDLAVSAFVYATLYSRIKISKEAALAYYDAHRSEFTGTFAESEEAINKGLDEVERKRRLDDLITSLAKRHGVRLIADLP